jgi:hypothetical protein
VKTERKYQLIKVAAGDWILPDNDGETVWRLRSYIDGPSMGLNLDHDITLWGYSKWTGRRTALDADDILDPDNWEYWDGNHRTRAEAIQAALNERER